MQTMFVYISFYGNRGKSEIRTHEPEGDDLQSPGVVHLPILPESQCQQPLPFRESNPGTTCRIHNRHYILIPSLL